MTNITNNVYLKVSLKEGLIISINSLNISLIKIKKKKKKY